MRDPARIDRMIELLRQRWHESPDQRLGQIVTNYATIGNQAWFDKPWLTEDDVTEANLLKGLS